jgi:hypothetical protein
MIIGLCLGAFSTLADGVVPGRAVTTLGNIISPWVIAAFAAGRLSPSPRAGSWAGTVALAVGVVTYYLAAALRFAVDDSAYAGSRGAAPVVWLVAALLVGPVMGAAGAASTRSRPPVLAVIAPSVVLFAEAAFLVLDRRPWRWTLPQEMYRLADVGVFAVLVAVALAMPYRLIAEPERRQRAYALMCACGLAGAAGIQLLYRLLRALV